MDINISLIKWHNDNSNKKVYNEMDFCYNRNWHLENDQLIIDRWNLDSPIPKHADLLRYTQKEINDFKIVLDEIQFVKKNSILTTNNKDFLKGYACNGSLIYEPSSKKLFIFLNGEWNKLT